MNEVQLTQKLVKINSENPPGNEEDAARFIYSYLKKVGLKPRLMKSGENRYNVAASIGKGKSGLMLNGHLDTVPIGDKKKWKFNPFSGRMSGAGSCNMRCT